MATYPPSGFAVDAIICDSAASAEGKLYIQGGGWNILMSPVFPFSQPRIGVGAIVSVPYHATNKNHVLELRLEDQDGERLPIGPTVMSDIDGTTKSPMGIKAQFNLGRPPILQAGDSQNIPMAINLDQLVFQSPGAYSFVLTINNEEMERLTFRVLGPASAGITATGGD
jgi:hypothetical protein